MPTGDVRRASRAVAAALSAVVTVVTPPECVAAGRLYGFSASGTAVRLTNFTFTEGTAAVAASAGAAVPCALAGGAPCSLSAGRGTALGGVAAMFEGPQSLYSTGAGAVVERDTASGALVGKPGAVAAPRLYGVHSTCEGGCSNGESLVNEHCAYLAVRAPAIGNARDIVCVQSDGSITASRPLPPNYTEALSGPFASHARLLMTNTFCWLTSSEAESAVLSVEVEFDPINDKLTTSLTSFTLSAPDWGNDVYNNPIVALIGEHPQQPNTLLVLAAREGAVVGGPIAPVASVRKGLYIAALTGPHVPSPDSKLVHVADLPAGWVACTPTLDDPSSRGFAFLDHGPTYPFANTSVVAILYAFDGSPRLSPKLVRVSFQYPAAAGAEGTAVADVQSWDWTVSFPDVMMFELARSPLE